MKLQDLCTGGTFEHLTCGKKSTIDLQEAWEQRKIVVFNLSKGKIGDAEAKEKTTHTDGFSFSRKIGAAALNADGNLGGTLQELDPSPRPMLSVATEHPDYRLVPLGTLIRQTDETIEYNTFGCSFRHSIGLRVVLQHKELRVYAVLCRMELGTQIPNPLRKQEGAIPVFNTRRFYHTDALGKSAKADAVKAPPSNDGR